MLRSILIAFVWLPLLGQNVISVEGTIKDSSGHPVANAAVQLKTESQTLTTKTGADGYYRFGSLPPGAWTLHSESSGQGEASFGPFQLESNHDKTVNLTLAASKPEFFDPPAFIVAGVSDGAARGGHGSDAILRSSEALTKAAAALGKEASTNPAPLPRQAELDERNRKPLEAVREYQRAAELDPSEPNLFDWGAELLAHRAYNPAIEVLTRGNQKFPRSTRMLLGLAVAYYGSGAYDQAAQRFFEVADLDPSDPSPYLFLARVQSDIITGSDGFLDRMRRFANLHPENAWANYYYAASLWRQKGTAGEVLALLEKARQLDPTLAAAELELAIVYTDQKNFPRAIAALQKAIEIDPRLGEAHYRLAQVYARTGEKGKAQQEFELHDKLAKQSAEQVERERREVQQFVIELRRPQ